jgi:SOS-response transcriptional repressor LexA
VSSPRRERKFKPSEIVAQNEQMVGGWKGRLVELMRERGLSQRQLSDASDLGSSTVRHLVVKAETLTLETALRLANTLDVSIAYLLFGVRSSVEGGDALPGQRVHLIGVAMPDDEPKAMPTGEHGVVSVTTSQVDGGILHALKIANDAMAPVGPVGMIQPDKVLLSGDVVVWSETLPEVGQLCIARVNMSGRTQTVCRLLTINDQGAHFLAANNVSFGRLPIDSSSPDGSVKVIGTVSLTIRQVN